MGKYIGTNGYWGNDGYYITGIPRARHKRLARLAVGDSWPRRLFSRYNRSPWDVGGVFLWMFLSVMGGIIVVLIGAAFAPFGASQAGSIIAWIGVIAGGISASLPILWFLYWGLGSVAWRFIRDTSVHGRKLAETPQVVCLSDGRPAVRALGNASWFAEHADQHGAAIDAFLTDPVVVEAERLLANPDINPELRTRTEVQLKRLAHGNIQAHIDALRAEKDGAAREALAAKQSLRHAEAEAANARLQQLLTTQLEPAITAEDIAKMDSR